MADHPTPQAMRDALRGVRWPAARRVPAGMPGAHRARTTGGGAEFVAYRDYRQGDDPRRIDWKLLARSDRAYVRVSEDRAWLPTWCVVDAGASMAFAGIGEAVAPSAWTTACTLVLGLAAVALAGGDPVGLRVATVDDRVPPRPARSRATVPDELARTLDAVPPAGSPPLATQVARVPRGARLVCMSDWLGDADATLAALARAAAAGSEVHVVQLLHPHAVLPPGGAWTARDPRGAAPSADGAPPADGVPIAAGTRRRDDERTLDRAAARVLAERVAAWRSELASACARSGLRFTTVTTDADPVETVRMIVRGVAPRGHASRDGAPA